MPGRSYAFDATSRGIFQTVRESGRTGSQNLKLRRYSETLGQPVALYREVRHNQKY